MTIEEAGGQSSVGATAVQTAFVLLEIQSSRTYARVGREAQSGVILGRNTGLGPIL